MITPAFRLPVQPWMKGQVIADIFTRLKTKASDINYPEILCVGGCVRNTLLGEAVGDIDLATVHSPDMVLYTLAEAGHHVKPTGFAHGTVTVFAGDSVFEITTLREDIVTDGRRAIVHFGTNWHADALRRDFTINALYADLEGRVYDPLTLGLSDLERRRVAFIGDADTRIREDFLRILRFFRFHALYGKGEPDPVAMQSCRNHAASVVHLSRERITAEMDKILSVDNFVETLALMDVCHLTEALGFSPFHAEHFHKLSKLQKTHAYHKLMTRYLMCYIGFDNAVDRIMGKFSFSNENIRLLQKILENMHVLRNNAAEKKIKELIYKSNFEMAAAGLVLAYSLGDKSLPDYVDKYRQWQPPSFPLRGHDLVSIGFIPGEKLGSVLQQLEDIWIESDFELSQKMLLDMAAERI